MRIEIYDRINMFIDDFESEFEIGNVVYYIEDGTITRDQIVDISFSYSDNKMMISYLMQNRSSYINEEYVYKSVDALLDKLKEDYRDKLNIMSDKMQDFIKEYNENQKG